MLETEWIQSEIKKSRCLMVVLHGLGDSREGYRWLPPAMRLPWLNYLLVDAPDPYYGGFSWFDLGPDAGRGIVRSRSLLFDLLDRVSARFPSEQTWVFGFSQGCLMTFEIGLRYPHRLAGLVGVSGWPHEPERQLRELSPAALRQKFLVTHGTLDPLVPFAEAKRKTDILRTGGVSVDWREFKKAHTIAGDEEMDVIRSFVQSGCRETCGG